MNRLETLMSVLMRPFQRFENATIQLLTLRRVDTATGEQLNVLGRIVGQPRDGLVDVDYRRYIRARVATNRSAGKREDLIRIARLVLNDSAARVHVAREGVATTTITIELAAITAAVATALISFLRDAVAIGVRLVLRYSLSTPATTFRLDSGPGLDVGHLAGSAE